MSNNTKVCSFDGCGRKYVARELCGGHYQQRSRGEALAPLGGRASTAGMTPSQRFERSVDRSGECHTWTGPLMPGGYGYLKVDGKGFLAHRFAFEEANGPIPEGSHVDHTCYNRACVNPAHLRAASPKQNNENREGLNRDNTSGYRGVCFSVQAQKWVAQVKHHHKAHSGGYFADVHEAGAAALALRMELYTRSDGR